jgi:hypothetical protein
LSMDNGISWHSPCFDCLQKGLAIANTPPIKAITLNKGVYFFHCLISLV